jgi:hypothetical protein
MKILKVKPIMSDEMADSYLGRLLKDSDYTTLVNYDCDVYCDETGELLAKFRKKVIDKNIILNAWNTLIEAATLTDMRGTATGGENGNSGTYNIKRDGTLSKTHRSNKINSGIIGYYDRTIRAPYCRKTSYTSKNFEKYTKCVPIVKRVNELYKELVPDRWEYQKDYVDRTSKDFVIEDTVFTTVTVNKNWQTAVHTDKGDLRGGFGNLIAVRKGKYTGGYFVLVKWGVAFDLNNMDVLFTDVHKMHGNTPIRKVTEDATRISLVMYYRENMIGCGSAEEEIYMVKNRKDLKGIVRKKDITK